MIVNLMNQPTMSQQQCGKFIFSYNNRKKGHQSDKRKRLCTSCRTVPRVRPKLDNFFGVFPPEPRFSILSWLSFMETLLVARNLGEDLDTSLFGCSLLRRRRTMSSCFTPAVRMPNWLQSSLSSFRDLDSRLPLIVHTRSWTRQALKESNPDVNVLGFLWKYSMRREENAELKQEAQTMTCTKRQ